MVGSIGSFFRTAAQLQQTPHHRQAVARRSGLGGQNWESVPTVSSLYWRNIPQVCMHQTHIFNVQFTRIHQIYK